MAIGHRIIHISYTRSTRFNVKVWSSDGNSFNQPITCSMWILALAVRFSTSTFDVASCLLLLRKGGVLAVTLYCKSKSSTLNSLSNKTEKPGVNLAAILVSSAINLSVVELEYPSDI